MLIFSFNFKNMKYDFVVGKIKLLLLIPIYYYWDLEIYFAFGDFLLGKKFQIPEHPKIQRKCATYLIHRIDPFQKFTPLYCKKKKFALFPTKYPGLDLNLPSCHSLKLEITY